MNKIAYSDIKELKKLFVEASGSNNKNLGISVIEKDFWVCWVLERIFSDNDLKDILCFKGGTSLSKVFNVIERFSEDIDIILHPKVLGLELEEKISKSQQNKFNEMIVKKGQEYITTVLKNKIEKLLNPICNVEIDNSDNCSLLVNYPQTDDISYLRPYVKLEIGPLAAWLPNSEYLIRPYLSDILPELQIKSFKVPTIKIERTFWEKVTILHRLHYMPKDKKADRISRHYYDVFKMANSKYKNSAFENIELLQEVVSFKDRYYHVGYAKYDLAKIGSLKLLPSKDIEEKLKADYKNMAGMIYGYYPGWEEIMNCLYELEKEINSL